MIFSLLFGLSDHAFAENSVQDWQKLVRNVRNGYTTSRYRKRILDVGRTPKGAAITRDGQYAYVANMYSNTPEPTVTVVDMQSYEMSRIQTPVGVRGYDYGEILGNIEVAMGFDGQYAYVSRCVGDKKSEIANSGLVTAIHIPSQKIHGYFPLYPADQKRGPNGTKIIALRPKIENTESQIAYVTNWFTNTQHLSVLDLGKLQAPIGEEKPKTYHEAFVKHIKLRTAAKGRHKHKIAARGILFTNDGRYALIAGFNSKTMFVVDGQKHEQIAELPSVMRGTNFRHFVYDAKRDLVYISHMSGDRISRFKLQSLIDRVETDRKENDAIVYYKRSIWEDIQVPFPNDKKFIRTDLRYPVKHPYHRGANRVEGPSNPNTIVLDPNGRYLYVSNRMTNKGMNQTPEKHIGKVDVIDTEKGEIIFSFNSGRQATALDITPDGKTLISSGFADQSLHLFDVETLKKEYEAFLLE